MKWVILVRTCHKGIVYVRARDITNITENGEDRCIIGLANSFVYDCVGDATEYWRITREALDRTIALDD